MSCLLLPTMIPCVASSCLSTGTILLSQPDPDPVPGLKGDNEIKVYPPNGRQGLTGG